MKHLPILALAASLGALYGCVVAPAATATVAEAQAGTITTITTTVVPPALPVYEQPVAPGPGYLWTPGYWAWGDAAYYWVPGVWVLPPRVGVLWTPGWWGWSDGFYRWHAGYWGPTIGFYGGINYGFGYFGTGYVGGEWRGNQFYYNRAVNNIHNTRITNVYVDEHVVRNTTINHVSYHGGRGGVAAEPTAMERAALQQPHAAPTAEQMRQHTMAMHERGQRYNPSGAGPAVYGSSRVGERFNEPAAPRAPAAMPPQAGPATLPNREAMQPREATAPRAYMPAPQERPAQERMQRTPMPQERAEQRREFQRDRAEVQRREPERMERARPERPSPQREREHEHERERQ